MLKTQLISLLNCGRVQIFRNNANKWKQQ
jgi:hypothetical protein